MTTRNERDRREVRKTDSRAWANKEEAKFERTVFRVPENGKVWRPTKAGTYKFDVIPFITGKHNPHADPDMLHFERSITVHTKMGLDGRSSYCCLARCFGRKCEACARLRMSSDNPMQDRILIQGYDITNSVSKAEGMQILDQPYGTQKHPNFGRMLKTKMQMVEDYLDFWDLDHGYTLVLNIVEDSFPGSKPYMKITNIEMVKRSYKYGWNDVDTGWCLDDLPIELSDEKMKEILCETLEGGVPSDEPTAPPEDKPRTTSRRGDDEPTSKSPGAQPANSNGRNRMTADPEEQPVRYHEPRGDEGRTDARGTVSGKPQEYKVGEFVLWDGIQWEVRRVNRTGTLDLEDDNGQTEANIDPKDVHRIRVRGRSEEGTVSTPTVRPSKPKEEDKEADDAPPPRRGRPARN